MGRILLTGATGLIGGAVLHRALAMKTDTEWVCLVRASDEEAGRQRLAARLGRFTSALNAQRLAQRVEIVPGDFTKADRIADPRLDSVTQVLHLAADTSWWAQEKVHRTNHDGTLALARRAARMTRLDRFLHVSTAMICGGQPPAMVDETRYPDADATHLVPYSASKSAAEMSLATHFADLPLVVARPSIVLGHTTLGARPGSSILWVIRACDRLRLVAGSRDGTVDIVPTDWVADTLVEMLARPALAHGTYHLSAGTLSRTRWSELGRTLDRVDPAESPRQYEEFSARDRATLHRRFTEVFGMDEAIKVAMFRALQAYYRFCELDVTFDNARLLAEGFAPPPALAQYIGRCIETSGAIVDQFREDFGQFAVGSLQRRDATRPAPSLPETMPAREINTRPPSQRRGSMSS
ncbi:Linear gramicidin synthase subunit D [Methylobacterium bullatum]|uniref:Linear gramicidin synthase subunit D n=1 Tax=Methylobacterium bullatum TaxID=570505 RepID=A0A679JMR7_9HYPH|nr:Linear gramicidin synthase subunit D [Methylobacterium bullatum]